ncbi:MAG TPA: Gfo/Idh/MocA family oxidoreductase [Terriglobia bacterium]|nr:Gfo/Idh/MocA family oxidoreductase [Terriglobia bacterium]
MRVRLGLIGCGAQGNRLLLQSQSTFGLEVVAVSDLYDGHLERAREIAGSGTAVSRDFRSVLDRADIDAVIIAVPGHWQKAIFEAAIQSGKDVYCEGPLGHSLEQGASVVAAAEKSGRIVQMGNRDPSSALCLEAREIVQGGHLGRVYLVKGDWNSTGSIAAWQFPYPPDASPQSIGWSQFEQPVKAAHAFSLQRFFRWRCFWDYGSGLAGDRLIDALTVVHWIMKSEAPAEVVASGGLYRWKDGRDVPDVFRAAFHYPEGFSVELSASQAGSRTGRQLQFLGSEASLTIGEKGMRLDRAPAVEPYAETAEPWAETYREWYYMMHDLTRAGETISQMPPALRQTRMSVPETSLLGENAHMLNFIECVRSRKPALVTARMGWQAAIAVHLANQSYHLRRIVEWDRASETMQATGASARATAQPVTA